MFLKSRARSSSLFLMELILAILFFSITSAVCVQFFVKSHVLSQQSQALNHAVNECSAVAEISRSSSGLNDTLTQIQEMYPSSSSLSDASLSDTGLTEEDMSLYYDKNFTSCPKEDHAYELKIHFTEKDHMLTADMTVESDSDIIYTLKTVNHLPRRVAHEE